VTTPSGSTHPDPTLDASRLLQLVVGTDELSRQLARARERFPEDQSGLVAALETAHEELRVAGEEVHTQHETICRLVESHKSLRLQQERSLAILPVPALVTDMHGAITSVNAAAAMMLRTPAQGLLGKPLVTLFSQEDRLHVRQMIRGRGEASGVGQVRRAVRLVERRGGSALVELSGSAQLTPGGTGEIAWFLLSTTSTAATRGLSESLARLATLPLRSTDLSPVLAAAATTCADVLAAHVAIAVAGPTAPRAVGSSSAVAQECDAAQRVTGAGPSLRALESGTTVASASLGRDVRWPELHGRVPAGVGPVLATPIRVLDRVDGTLTAYATAGSTVDQETAQLLALTLGRILHEIQLIDELDRLELHMQEALGSSSLVDQADDDDDDEGQRG
jgi:PAS domain S-box-containing protein